MRRLLMSSLTHQISSDDGIVADTGKTIGMNNELNYILFSIGTEEYRCLMQLVRQILQRDTPWNTRSC